MDKREDILKIMQALGGGPGIIALLTALSLFMSISYNIIYFFIIEKDRQKNKMIMIIIIIYKR